MDHFNQRVRSGRTHTASKLFISILSSKIWSTHFITIDSKIFETIGVSEIGRIYFSIDRGGCFFGSGITCAVFHKAGLTPSRSEVLKSAVKGQQFVLALSLRTHPGTLSGPTALFTLICCKAFSVSCHNTNDIFSWDL